MKFRRLYILPILALGLAACSNEDDNLFDQSAAERLESGQKEYFSTLCADGGTWAMEYFANENEPGYLFVMKFHNDKSVEIATDHKWIDSQFHSERSLWDVINDNGNVLTFNSYNTLFHIFSTPENVVGPDAELDSNGEDVDEQGYGHNGDYEFMLMENANDHIRLLGKKRGYYAYLRRLPSDTDAETYLSVAAEKRASVANKKFPTFVMTETATGATYDVTGLGSGVVSVVPFESEDPFGQTETKACIITAKGMRPIKTFEVIRDNHTTFAISEFTWADDGSLTAPGVRITAQKPGVSLQNVSYSWILDKESMSPTLQTAHDAASAQLQSVVGTRYDLRNVIFGYSSNSGKISLAITTYVGTRICRDYLALTVSDNKSEISLSIAESNKASNDLVGIAPEYVKFKQLLTGDFTISNTNVMNPSAIKFTSKSNPEIYFTVNVQ